MGWSWTSAPARADPRPPPALVSPLRNLSSTNQARRNVLDRLLVMTEDAAEFAPVLSDWVKRVATVVVFSQASYHDCQSSSVILGRFLIDWLWLQHGRSKLVGTRVFPTKAMNQAFGCDLRWTFRVLTGD